MKHFFLAHRFSLVEVLSIALAGDFAHQGRWLVAMALLVVVAIGHTYLRLRLGMDA